MASSTAASNRDRSITLALPAAIHELIELEDHLFPETSYGYPTLARHIAADECWVARGADPQVLGYYILSRHPCTSELVRLGVAREVQRGGLGRQLLLHALSHDRTCSLWVAKDNRPAISLYRQHGFNIVASIRRHWIMTTGSPRVITWDHP